MRNDYEIAKLLTDGFAASGSVDPRDFYETVEKIASSGRFKNITPVARRSPMAYTGKADLKLMTELSDRGRSDCDTVWSDLRNEGRVHAKNLGERRDVFVVRYFSRVGGECEVGFYNPHVPLTAAEFFLASAMVPFGSSGKYANLEIRFGLPYSYFKLPGE